MPKPKPLTPAQRRALQAIAEHRVYAYRPFIGPVLTVWCCEGQKPPAGNTMNALQRRGWFSREGEQNRRKYLILTEAGRAALTADA